MNIRRPLWLAFTAVAIVATAARLWASEPPPSERWLVAAPDEAARLERLEKYLRGFDQPMWEVGERYLRLEQALRDGNFELARYHWEKIRVTTENGLMKRPARRANAEGIFLGAAWKELDAALASRDAARVQRAFATAKGACMACHVAENVTFMNDQPMFRAALPVVAIGAPAAPAAAGK